jgi:hypothetical protein
MRRRFTLTGRTGRRGVARLAVIVAAALAVATLGARQTPPAQGRQSPAPAQPAPPAGELGYTDTPMLPGMPWHVHDPARPHPHVVTPGAAPGAPPSDAIVLFDGKDLAHWAHHGTGANAGKVLDATWPVRDGYFEVGKGDLYTRESFGDMQVHLEWASPGDVHGTSQGRGNSGLKVMGLYEVQILDSFGNPTYADGQAAAVYGQWPPLANVARKPGEWQTYDVVFEAPRFEGDKLVKPAYVTVIWNGVLVHVHREVMGTTIHRQLGKYTPHAAELPFFLQDHNSPVRYRNVWVRRLAGYDQPER